MNRTPPLLIPFLTPVPSVSLTLLTSVLGASTNWLILRLIHASLFPPNYLESSKGGFGDAREHAKTKVILVSFMRDWEFWKDSARRITGILTLGFTTCVLD